MPNRCTVKESECSVDGELVEQSLASRRFSERSLGLSPTVYRQCSESLDDLVMVGAVCSKHTIEVRAVDVHHGHQHVGRCNYGGTSPDGDMEGVLGDLCDHVATIDTRGSGSRTIGALALRLEGSLAYAERL